MLSVGRPIQLAIVTLLALFALVLPLAPPAAGAVQAASVDPMLEQIVQASSGAQARFIVQFRDRADLTGADSIRDWTDRGRFVVDALQRTADRSQAELLRALRSDSVAGTVSYFQPYWIINAVVVEGDRQALAALAAFPGIESIRPAAKIEPPDPVMGGPESLTGPAAVSWGVTQIGADQVWNTFGARGEGIVVANIDTGVRYTHEALVRQYRGNLGSDPSGPFDHDYNWFDSFWGTTAPQALPWFVGGTPYAHGTHVMGTLVGEDPAQANQIGVAPGARWIAAYGCCPDEEALLAATQWMLAPTRLDGSDPDPAMRPHVIQNSWGGPGGFVTYNGLIDSLHAAGIFNAYSAGNSGPNCGTLLSPGDNPIVFSVGATTIADAIWLSSSRGPNPFTRTTGPDLSAPGVGIRSAVSGSDIAYSSGTGTSMAGPHLAGTVALLWSLEPDLVGRVDETAAILRGTALPLTGAQACDGVSGTQVPNNAYGWGRLDALAAAQMAYQAGTLRGTVTDLGSNDAIEGASVAITRNGKTIRQQTGADGRFSFLIGQGTYTMTVSAHGYDATTVAGITVIEDGDTVQHISLQARPRHVVSGQVSDGSNPIWGARLWVEGQPAGEVLADALGQFSLMVPEGSHRLVAEMEGFEIWSQSIHVTGTLTQPIVLSPTADYYLLTDQGGPGCTVPYAWEELEGHPGASALALGDDAFQPVTLSSLISFYGIAYGTANVNSNGFVQFGQSHPTVHGVIPFEGSPNGAVYGLASDLNPANGTQGLIYHAQVGNQWVVQYDQVEHWSSGDPETFQFLFETSSGEIIVQYQGVANASDSLAGIENSDGSRATIASKANWPPLVNGSVLKLIPFAGLSGAHRPADVNCDGQVDVLDIVMVASAWTTQVGDPGYLLGYDMDQDGDVDIVDVQLLAWWWGWQQAS